VRASLKASEFSDKKPLRHNSRILTKRLLAENLEVLRETPDRATCAKPRCGSCPFVRTGVSRSREGCTGGAGTIYDLRTAYWGIAVATSLIHELQLDATNDEVSVSNLLRKALIVAAKLEVPDVPEWLEKELSGYRGGDTLPSYRVVHGAVKARGLRGWLPAQFPTNELEETVSKKYIYDSVAQIEALRNQDGMLAMSFPAEAAQALQQMFAHETEFICVLEKTKFDAIVDEIRNQVLRWALALDKVGIRGDGMAFTGEEKEKAHSVVFHVDGGNVNVGVIGNVSGRANVATGVQPRAGGMEVDDVRKLVEELRAHIGTLPLSPTNQQELEVALTELTTASSGKSVKTGAVRQALDRLLAVVGKAGETIVSVGIKAFVESCMKQHSGGS
jgi:hypothetical protein